MTFYRVWDFLAWCVFFMLIGTAVVVVVKHPEPLIRVLAVLWATIAGYRQGRLAAYFKGMIDGLVTRL
jgi:ABC-type dipeptide/oligopeptide/nickel transport system permease subunit